MPLTAAETESFINQAIAAGIPVAEIERFRRDNPGDEHRLLSALGGAREQLAPYTPNVLLPQSYLSPPSPERTAPMDRDDIAAIPVGSGYSTSGFSDWGEVIGDVISGDYGGAIESAIGLLPGGRLPLPPPGGGRVPPRLPPAGGGTINIPPIPSGGGMTAGAAAARVARIIGRMSPAAIAAATAAAGALGMSLADYLLTVQPRRRRMNVLNPRALTRSLRRVGGFEKFARRTVRFNVKKRFKTKRKRA